MTHIIHSLSPFTPVSAEKTIRTPPAKPFNVFVLLMDSVSRLNSIRHLPKTRSFLLEHLNATEFFVYNAVGKNTYPNMAAMFMGKIAGGMQVEGGGSMLMSYDEKGVLENMGCNCKG